MQGRRCADALPSHTHIHARTHTHTRTYTRTHARTTHTGPTTSYTEVLAPGGLVACSADLRAGGSPLACRSPGTPWGCLVLGFNVEFDVRSDVRVQGYRFMFVQIHLWFVVRAGEVSGFLQWLPCCVPRPCMSDGEGSRGEGEGVVNVLVVCVAVTMDSQYGEMIYVCCEIHLCCGEKYIYDGAWCCMMHIWYAVWLYWLPCSVTTTLPVDCLHHVSALSRRV